VTDDDLGPLIERAAAGDRSAAGEVAERCEGRLRRAIHHRLGPELRRRLDTDDLVQSTIAVALRDLRQLDYQNERAFAGWLEAIAERRIKMAVRKHRAEKRDVRRDRAVEAAAGVAIDATSPTRAARRSEAKASLEEAVKELPEQSRRVVELHSFDGKSFAEVAEILGLADKNAAYYLFQKSLKQMGRALRSHTDERDD
jgi:RNA polymerase sigma-70 factor, ECF subfamily